MNIQDKGIILTCFKIQEKLLLITIFSEHNGICKGILKNYSTSKNQNLQPLSIVDFSWKARLENQLGQFSIEFLHSYQQHVMFNKSKLYSFKFFASLISSCFKEHDQHDEFYSRIIEYLNYSKIHNYFSWKNHFNLEVSMLESLGYSLELSKCCVTNIENDLLYVSPKTGRAVSRIAAIGYEKLLLKLPNFLTMNSEPSNLTDINDAFTLTDYFFQRYIYPNINNKDEIIFNKNMLKNLAVKNIAN